MEPDLAAALLQAECCAAASMASVKEAGKRLVGCLFVACIIACAAGTAREGQGSKRKRARVAGGRGAAGCGCGDQCLLKATGASRRAEILHALRSEEARLREGSTSIQGRAAS